MKEKIKIVISKDKMEFAYIDNILTGNIIDINNNYVEIESVKLFEIVENKNNIRGSYVIQMIHAYLDNKIKSIYVDLIVTDMFIDRKTRIINAEKYVNTNAYKYIKKNHTAMMTKALHKVTKNLRHNVDMIKGITEKFNRACHDDEDFKVYLLKYINSQLGQQYTVNISKPYLTDYLISSTINEPDLELKVMFVNYINLHSLTGIVFIESKDLDYVRTIGEEFENSKRKKCRSPFENLDESKNDDERKKEKVVASLLAAYCYVENDNVANAIKSHFDFKDDKFDIGKYIFICANSIDDFIKRDISKIYTKEKPMCFDKNDVNCKEKCPLYKGKEKDSDKVDATDLAIKFIFLHEVGHMAFTNCSTNKKLIANETLANWFASICVDTCKEKCMIREITKYQPIEYKYYFTNPQEFEHATLKDYANYNHPMFRTLKFGMIDIHEYDNLYKILIESFVK